MLIKQRFLLFPKIADSAKILAPRWRLAAKDAGRSLARNITRLDEESARILIHVPGGWKPPLQA